ncbi:MAG: UDP-N-acetylmuramoyl-L-alanyl-D-glutamate--2,6-diaminopimelate ligase [Lachnospiraceae bacterium]|nr:UDP-N-acetylmuramoyl-L-alanyl-D-glutamate--2,6-diaminopimelate ligase [Lachnospiraceae bacterium]
MKLEQICANFSYQCIKGSMDVEVQDIIYDSRKIKKGVMFVCLTGAVTDGHKYISEVVKKGVSVIVLEREKEALQVPDGITVLKVSSARKALAFMSAAFFHYPARKLVTVGVTGTNGKTTTTHIIKGILESVGKKVGLIGTNGAMIGEQKIPLKNTTPESYELHRLFAAMIEDGCQYVIMEVSSQGLKMDRTVGIIFDYGIFTNLSPDHIGPNEHANFAEYLECKSILFRQCKCGIVNMDDPNYDKILQNHTCHVKTFTTNSVEKTDRNIDLMVSYIEPINENGKLGMHFYINGLISGDMRIYIPGKFSVYNALAAMLTCHLIGISDIEIQKGLEKIQVKGRLEFLPISRGYTMLIDYAHNRKSTENVLSALLEYHPNHLICVYGCGGNRSKLRRFDMGEITGRMADLCVLTCDNPRNEEISDINADIKVGIKKSKGNYVEIDDRKKAIEWSILKAKQGDIILLLGKGHEDYQEVKGVKFHFDEREVVREILRDIDEKISM